MAFTPFERQLISMYFGKYGGKAPGAEYDEQAIQDFMIADEDGKRTLLKTMVTDLLIPTQRETVDNLQESRVAALTRLAVLSAYVSV